MAKQYIFVYGRNSKLIAKASANNLTDARAVAYGTIEGRNPRYRLKNGAKASRVVILPTPNADDEDEVTTNTVYFSKDYGCIVCVEFDPSPYEITSELLSNGKLGEELDFCD